MYCTVTRRSAYGRMRRRRRAFQNRMNAMLIACAARGDVTGVLRALRRGANKDAGAGQETAFHAAAVGGHVDVIDALAAVEAEPRMLDCDGRTPLEVAALHFKVDAVKAFVRAGASDDLHRIWFKYAEEANFHVLMTLTAAGADVNAEDNVGYSALMYAAVKPSTACFHALLTLGAEKEHETPWGHTALTLAAERGHDVIVTTLILSGVNVHQVTYYGETAYDLAASNGHVTCVQALLLAGAGADYSDAESENETTDDEGDFEDDWDSDDSGFSSCESDDE